MDVPETGSERGSDESTRQLTDLRLLHLADSALPIGVLAHSFGLESLVAAKVLDLDNLGAFLRGWLAEAGTMEAVFCREAFRLGCANPESIPTERWLEINALLSARKTARESRMGSIVLGRNFLSLVASLHELAPLSKLLAEIRRGPELHRNASHYSVAFGFVAGLLGCAERRSVLTYLHQTSAGMVSACQRLLPLGQTEAARILWNLKPAILEAAARSTTCGCEDTSCFMPLLDWGAMEHPALPTRLFVS